MQDSKIDPGERPPLLQERIAFALVEVGPIHGAKKAKLVADQILGLMMLYYAEELAAQGGTDD